VLRTETAPRRQELDAEPAQPKGLLIVNADDFGGNRLATDRIERCFAARRITSASAMVYMSDSLRAAEIARSRDLPIGLHLNLTQPFDDPSTPSPVRERQAKAARHFARGRRARFTYNPFLRDLVESCLADQLARFRESFERQPTHIDGHNHAHLSPTVLLALPKKLPVRTAERQPNARPTPGELMRRVRHAFIERRGLTTECFYAIDPLAAEPSLSAIEALLTHADRSSVEIMTHPDRDRDFELLMSDDWLRGLRKRQLGSFRDLRVRRGAVQPDEINVSVLPIDESSAAMADGQTIEGITTVQDVSGPQVSP
jgi:predicted glycoside hydrolase/deacetylase ChbG (UPF0249 family)